MPYLTRSVQPQCRSLIAVVTKQRWLARTGFIGLTPGQTNGVSTPFSLGKMFPSHTPAMTTSPWAETSTCPDALNISTTHLEATSAVDGFTLFAENLHSGVKLLLGLSDDFLLSLHNDTFARTTKFQSFSSVVPTAHDTFQSIVVQLDGSAGVCIERPRKVETASTEIIAHTKPFIMVEITSTELSFKLLPNIFRHWSPIFVRRRITGELPTRRIVLLVFLSIQLC
mmetsp:Transcript_4710/g.14353  ORF Transcript_4710/g.14353 Transcript_4710/m.14353 type:complete len:226 (-) Transcript_4710:1071-1748(-)